MCLNILMIHYHQNIIFVCYSQSLINEPLLISIKWLVFIATLFICFWTGILSDENKWRGIHGGQVAPEQHSTLYQFEN